MEKYPKPRILLAPLDWGLGHATRCIPLIKALQNQNFEVFVGASGKITALLQLEFPELTFIPLKGYGINYAKKRSNFMFSIFAQLPKICKAIQYENKRIKQIVAEYQIDIIISDNRLGCYHKKIPSIFVTHQLNILTGFQLFDRWALKTNYYFINKYSECWVPDCEGEHNIAGVLSHPLRQPKTSLRYLGLLSRFECRDEVRKIPLTILISGPEPQRSIFEKLLIEQAESYKIEALVIRGLPDDQQLMYSSNEKLQFRNHVPAQELELILQQSELIIARSGYSTIMDLIALQKKAILIPTPGQTEQEYLAKRMLENQLFFTVSQADFNMKKNIEDVVGFESRRLSYQSSLTEVLSDWKLNLIKKNLS